MLLRNLCLLLFLLNLTACENLALLMTPAKKPIPSHTRLSQQAEQTFWDTLHKGQYEKIPYSQKLLMAAYLENPNDPQLAAHLGFLHIWRITERARLKSNEPDIVNEIILSKKYFGDAMELNPRDARIQGFLGDTMLVEGTIFHDQKEEVRGYFQLKRAIKMWPEFNYFTAGYPMSNLSPQSEHFQEGLAWQWKTMDLCAETKIDPNHPDFSPYMQKETQQGPKRACWNSWIAPHNFEGFFLNMGDMLVKNGDWQTAIKIYNNAKLSKQFTSWPYKNLLNERIQQAKENVSQFQMTNHARNKILFNSGYGCVVCHQK